MGNWGATDNYYYTYEVENVYSIWDMVRTLSAVVQLRAIRAVAPPSKYKIKTPSAEALGEFILMKSVVTDQLQVFVFKTSNSQLATHWHQLTINLRCKLIVGYKPLS